jgi:hypothetical protein
MRSIVSCPPGKPVASRHRSDKPGDHKATARRRQLRVNGEVRASYHSLGHAACSLRLQSAANPDNIDPQSET